MSRRTSISHNTWIHQLARVLVRPLLHTSITPNQITTLRLVSGLASALAFASGQSPWQHVGGVLLVLSLVLDRADGELARLSGKTTPWGHKYDLFCDWLCDTLVLVGIGIGLRDSILGIWSIPLGIIAGISVAMIFWLVFKLEALQGARAAELQSHWGFDTDDALLFIPIAVWLGWSVPLLSVAGVVAPIFALYFFWRFRDQLGADGSSQQSTPK